MRTHPRDLPIPPMDKEPGDKDSAFTWAMGNLILARIAARETMKAITADPRMPAYCTVYRWMQVEPEFGEAVQKLREMLACARRAEADERRDLMRRRRKDGARWHGGRRPTVEAWVLDAILRRVRGGASLSAALATPGMPSAKAFYTRLRGCPGFRAAYADACQWRDIELEVARDVAVENVLVTGIPAANATIRALEGRRGRLRPKLYREEPRDLDLERP